MPAAPPASSATKAKQSSAAQEAKALQAFLNTHAAELEQLPNGKIRCTLTNTDLPARLPTLQHYWQGPALARAREAISDAELAEKYPTLQPHKSNKSKLYCTLTRLTLNRRRSHVEAHVKGKKYQKEQAKQEERRREREERERKRREKESGKDDDVESRLPEGALEEDSEEADAENENEEEDEGEVEETQEEEEEWEQEEEEQEEEEEEEEDMPIVRRVAAPASRKRKSREEEKEAHAHESDEDGDEQAEEDEDEDEEEEEEEEEQEQKQKRPTAHARGKAIIPQPAAQQREKHHKQQRVQHTNGDGSAVNGHTNKRQAVGAVKETVNKPHMNGNKRTGQAAGKKR